MTKNMQYAYANEKYSLSLGSVANAVITVVANFVIKNFMWLYDSQKSITKKYMIRS